MGSARPRHFDVGGPLCDTWTPKPCNAAQSGRKLTQIVLKSTKNGPKVVPKVASRVQQNTKYILKNIEKCGHFVTLSNAFRAGIYLQIAGHSVLFSVEFRVEISRQSKTNTTHNKLGKASPEGGLPLRYIYIYTYMYT